MPVFGVCAYGGHRLRQLKQGGGVAGRIGRVAQHARLVPIGEHADCDGFRFTVGCLQIAASGHDDDAWACAVRVDFGRIVEQIAIERGIRFAHGNVQ